MATSNATTRCFICNEKTTHSCTGCENYFCVEDFMKHREELKSQFQQIQHQTNEFVQILYDQQKTILNNHPAIIQINLWEQKSIENIKQTAQEQRQIVQQSIHGNLPQIQTQFNDFTQQIQEINKREDFDEKVLEKLQIQLKQIQQQINQTNNIEIKQDSSSTFIQKLSIQMLHSQHQPKSNLKWKADGQTIAGGNGEGNKLNQLNSPFGICVDQQQQQHIYITDFCNHRILKWKLGENEGQIVAGGNGLGNRIDQLNWPTVVIVDENNKSLIISDYGNRRVVRWSLENTNDKQILIENISCSRLMMNENGDLFVSDYANHSVKRWRKTEIRKGGEGTIVAGGNGQGNQLNQLNTPTNIFIDREETIYVSDWGNNRVMKWLKGENEGIIVAGGNDEGNSLKQLNHPQGLVVNEVGDVYVADLGNNRIMCWSLGSKEGRVVVGGNGEGEESNQFFYPSGLTFDIENNLYVVDHENHRIQRFDVVNS